MTTSDILGLARQRLQDTKAPYLWQDWELLLYLNQVYIEWAKETGVLLDDSTPAITQIPLVVNQATYTLHSQITEVRYGRLLTAGRDVKVKSDIWVSQFIRDWKTATGTVEYMVPDYDYGKIRVVRIPDTVDTLYLTVTRIPATLTATVSNAQNPEIRVEDHIKLIDGIMREAYLKKDADTLDPKASKEHGEIFELNKLKARDQKDKLRWSDVVARPDFGSL